MASTSVRTLSAAPPAVNVANVNAHLQQLQTFASSNGGNRATGTAGHTATTTYLQQKLQAAGYTVTVQTCTTCSGSAKNIIADWPGGDTSNTYMFGAHSDSVSAGPGINDDGSGTATLLEAALVLAANNPAMTNHVRFGWWAGEEQGLIGSKFYVNSLTTAQRTAIKAYGTFDMIASTNGGYFVTGTDAVAVKLREYFTSINVPTETSTECCSDDGSFRNAGIPSSINSTGASYKKTSAQVAKWGGTAGQAYDPCYHKACDSYPSNINSTSLGRWANAELYAAWTLTTGTAGPGGCASPGQKLGNPGFETATTPWTASTGVIGANTGEASPRTGTRDAWLNGNGSTSTETLSQSVALPAGCSTYTLSFYLKISTAETTTSTQYDKLTVQAGSTTLQVFSNLNAGAYTLRSYNLAAFAGQTVTLKFTGVEDSSLKTSFVIDDTALTVS
ncbi:M28 family peptidase [Actinoplanes sp. LDG1-01]|uniref:M28 family peptidase n=1 Tax=Paractinoplanes lichenicola TaxID=2802976 RepID=A0ABS1W4E3_9ACTN|nr:M28 family peptidase [Actinoplanes lichenicola]